jgi:threonine dehydratase
MSGLSHAINAKSIAHCEKLIRPCIRRTPVFEMDPSDVGLSADKLYFKLELVQRSGSFKARGAFANLRSRDVPAAGVAAASGGNYRAAMAYASMQLKVRARIFVPVVSTPAKIERIRA